jgi:hypothetical protein
MTAGQWTTAADVRAHVLRLWDRGRLLAGAAVPDDTFPLRVALKRPTTSELGTRFDDVRAWVAALRSVSHGRMELRDVNHRQLGPNQVPHAVWFDTLDDAAAFTGKTRELRRFRALVDITRSRLPELLVHLAKRPMDVLAVADEWPRLLDVVEWIAGNPRPGIYLRQVDVPGVHTKFIELHQRTLGAMLDLVLPEPAIDAAVGHADFCRRYGFRDRPRLVRFRYLDPKPTITSIDHDRHLTLTASDFGRITPPGRVFMTENEINFLAFPESADAMVVFGAGSGFDHLANALWLADTPVHYWGDIDTHGMAILDQLRGYVPHAVSMMMDRDTLLAHRDFWGVEDKPTRRELSRLNLHEADLYDDLRDNRLQPNLRLEQERIRFGWVRAAVARATEL